MHLGNRRCLYPYMWLYEFLRRNAWPERLLCVEMPFTIVEKLKEDGTCNP